MLIRPLSSTSGGTRAWRPECAEDSTLLGLRTPTSLRALAATDPRLSNRLRHRAVELADRGALAIDWDTFSKRPIVACGRERDNAAGEARERELHPEWYRYLATSAPNHQLKRLEANEYLRRIEPWLGQLGPEPRVLDLGGGTGRLAIPLAQRGMRLTLADANPRALGDAAAALAEGDLAVSIGLAGADDAGAFESGVFDACLSIEVLCYLEHPDRAASELARLLRPGGLAIVSVESWPGGLLTVPELGADELASALRDRIIHRPGDLFVRYFDREALARLLSDAGLDVVDLVAHHHVLEGPWRAVLDGLDLDDAGTRERIATLERAVAREPTLAGLGRAWLAIARRV